MTDKQDTTSANIVMAAFVTIALAICTAAMIAAYVNSAAPCGCCQGEQQ